MEPVQPPPNVVAPIEQIFSVIPFGSTPLGRTVLGLGAGTAIAYYVRPSMSFFPDGRPRPWIITDSKNPESTVMPYWAYPLVPAILFGVLL